MLDRRELARARRCRFALPYLADRRLGPLGAFVGVAPTGAAGVGPVGAPVWASIATPTLDVYGSDDVALGFAGAGYFAGIPGAAVTVLQGAPHACYLPPHAREFNAIVAGFLAEHYNCTRPPES